MSSEDSMMLFKVVSQDFIPDERLLFGRPGGLPFASWAQRFFKMLACVGGERSVFTVWEVIGSSSGKRFLVWIESLENEEHLDVDSCEIRDDSVLYNDGWVKDCMDKEFGSDAGVRFWSSFSG
ncbi:hypothetical protein Tco_1081854 [Tanacetum coccineum]|uniref:Uncharacterized protein n=1 Tax=Tanacetum coccineum TaxID=301880 RepID=A0ABQ5HYU7_9ASTR